MFFLDKDPRSFGQYINEFCSSKLPPTWHAPQNFEEFRQDGMGTFETFYDDSIRNNRVPLPVGDRNIVLEGSKFSEVFNDAKTKAETHISNLFLRRLVIEAAEEMSKEAFFLF